MSKNLSHLSFRQNKNTHLFEVFGDAAAATGTVPVDTMRETAKANLFGESNVIGAVSFYDFLKEENEGKKVYVCNGTACLLAGTQDELHEHLKKHFKE